MVYCTKCGAKNEDGAEVCVDCGERLYPTRTGHQRLSRRQEDMCFGPQAGSYWGIFIGTIIVFVGLFWFLQQAKVIPQTLEIWPLIIIIFGIMVIISVLTRPKR